MGVCVRVRACDCVRKPGACATKLKNAAFTSCIDLCARDTHTGVSVWECAARGQRARGRGRSAPQQIDSPGGRHARPVRGECSERAPRREPEGPRFEAKEPEQDPGFDDLDDTKFGKKQEKLGRLNLGAGASNIMGMGVDAEDELLDMLGNTLRRTLRPALRQVVLSCVRIGCPF